MAAWRKEEVDAARHRQEKKKATESGKVVIVHGSVQPAKRYQMAYLVDEPKNSCTGTRRTET